MGSFVQDRLLIICVVVAINHIAVAKAQCYYPGGAWAKDQFPCDKYAYTTLCCPTGWTCFSNNLCIATDPSVVSSDLPMGTAIRGTCTNPAWNDTACGDFCLNDPVLSNNGSVVPCGNNKWCCEPDNADGMCNCNTGKGTFQLSDGTAQTIIGVVGLQHTSTGSVVAPSSVAQSASTAAAVSKLSSESVTPTTSLVSSRVSSATSLLPSSTSSSQSSKISSSSAARLASTTSLVSTTSTGSGSAASQTNQQILDTSSIPVTQTIAFKAGVGAAAGIVFAIIIGLIIWVIVRWWQRKHGRGSEFGDGSIGNKWGQNPTASETPFQVAPTPHPYDDPQFSTSQSRTALAEQVAHNRRTPRPIDIIDENNPYADHYMAGGAGR